MSNDDYSCNVTIVSDLTVPLYRTQTLIEKGVWENSAGPPSQIGQGETVSFSMLPSTDQPNGCGASVVFATAQSDGGQTFTLTFYCDKNHKTKVSFDYTGFENAVLFDAGAGQLNSVDGNSRPLNVTFTLTYKINQIVNRSPYPLALASNTTCGDGTLVWAPGLNVDDDGYSLYPMLLVGPSAKGPALSWMEVTVTLDGTLKGDQYLIGAYVDENGNSQTLMYSTDACTNTPGQHQIVIKGAPTDTASHINQTVTWTFWTGSGGKAKSTEGDPLQTRLEMFVVFAPPDVMWNQTGVWARTIRDIFLDMPRQQIDPIGVDRPTAMNAITQSCFSGFNDQYIHTYGVNHLGSYSDDKGNPAIDLALYYSGAYGADPNRMGVTNCVGQTMLVQAMFGAIGLDSSVGVTVEPWGFSATAELVGRVLTNNPFYYKGGGSTDYAIVDPDNPGRTRFSSHVFVLVGADEMVIDACVGPQLATLGLRDYLAAAQDSQGPYNEGNGLSGPAGVDDAVRYPGDGLTVKAVIGTPSLSAASVSGERFAVKVDEQVIDADWPSVLCSAASNAKLDCQPGAIAPGPDCCFLNFTLSGDSAGVGLGGSVFLEMGGAQAAGQRFAAQRQARFLQQLDQVQNIDAGLGDNCIGVAADDLGCVVWQYYNAVVYLDGPQSDVIAFLQQLQDQLQHCLTAIDNLNGPDLSALALSAGSCQVGDSVSITADQGLSQVVLNTDFDSLRMSNRNDAAIVFTALAAGSVQIEIGSSDPQRLTSSLRAFDLTIT